MIDIGRMSFWWASVLCLAAGASYVVASEQPNILVIISEDNGPELGCYGDPYVSTPVLDKLADRGIRFEHAYVPQAGCSQSRAAYMTGLYPHQNGQIGLATWKFRMYREDTPNLVRSLKQAGYRTGIIGKLHVNPESAFPFDFHAIPSSNFSRNNLGRYAKQAEKFIAAGEAPFYLAVNYPDAHRPFTPRKPKLPVTKLTGQDVKPLPYMGLDSDELRQQTADYYNCMSRLDSLVGDLLEVLERSGKADNTLVVYFGDHGADLLRGKRTSYEGGVRVPMIAYWPGHTAAGGVRNELVSTLDLMPTFLEVAGAEPVAGLAGSSLVPLLGESPADWREYLFTEFHTHSAHNYYPQRTVRNERFKLIQSLLVGEENPDYSFTLSSHFPQGFAERVIETASPPMQAVYARQQHPPEFELYDLSSDPYELRNLADDPEYAEVLAELKDQLADWRERSQDPLLDVENLQRLKSEIEACRVEGKFRKELLELDYPQYFFDDAANGKP
ncbi:sulfatase [Aeoliella sp. ICT_H6.2]|uniref:Sulfatase n=1 Tax=Aeoliella straminimaris TaxID=2954799 RepID=A0A9X2FHD6_9BACT|nr:sulfatase [Aeoliella straminimaris]MCO6046774.1 sulfatase [Aeoliella straminimaris]